MNVPYLDQNTGFSDVEDIQPRYKSFSKKLSSGLQPRFPNEEINLNTPFFNNPVSDNTRKN